MELAVFHFVALIDIGQFVGHVDHNLSPLAIGNFTVSNQLMDVSKAIRSYRGLVRAARLAFKGDSEALIASQQRIRSEYAQPVADRAELLKRVQMAKDVAHILTCNVVQGVQNKKGNFKLGIHKSTELGDNDSRFQANIVKSGSSNSGCCGGGASAAGHNQHSG